MGWELNRSCRAAYTCALLSAINSSFSIIKIPQGHMPASTPEDVTSIIIPQVLSDININRSKEGG